MSDAFTQMCRVADTYKVPLRVAGYILAVQRVAQAEKQRGYD
jgi:glutamate dehydrogenase/leucine dehydrogenase